MRLIGYWDDGSAEWPDPRNFVDAGWDEGNETRREKEGVSPCLRS